MGLWKDQKDMWRAVTSPEMAELMARSRQLERPSMLDGIRQANVLMEQMGEQWRLQQSGVRGTAYIETATDTGASLNDQPVVEFALAVEVPGRAPYRTSLRQPMPRLMPHAYAPGQTVAVRVDPENPAALMIDLSIAATAPGVPAQDSL